jgi:hypothetical protein
MKWETLAFNSLCNNRNRNNPLLSFIDDEQFNSGVGSHGLDKSNGHILPAGVADDIIPQSKLNR